jgi:hypothetical protein
MNQNTAYGNKKLGNDSPYGVHVMAGNEAGPGCKIGKQTPVSAQAGFFTKGKTITTATKAVILDQLAKVKGESFAVFCIKQFVRNAHLKTDQDIIQMVEDLQDQMRDSEEVMKRVLGDQYDFIRDIKMG